MGVTQLIFELIALKAKIKGVFIKLYCCYSDYQYQENGHNLSTNN